MESHATNSFTLCNNQLMVQAKHSIYSMNSMGYKHFNTVLSYKNHPKPIQLIFTKEIIMVPCHENGNLTQKGCPKIESRMQDGELIIKYNMTCRQSLNSSASKRIWVMPAAESST